MTSDPEQLDGDLDEFFRLHEERWETRGGSSSGAADVKRLQRKFAAAAFERGWLRLWIAEADGAPGRCLVWLADRRSLLLRVVWACSALRAARLGTVLLAHTIEQAAAEAAGIYDLMWGDEGYKRRFETGRRDADTWVLGRRRHPLQLAAAARTAVERRARDARGS